MVIARTVRTIRRAEWRKRIQDGEREEERYIDGQETRGSLLRVAGDDWLAVRIYAQRLAKDVCSRRGEAGVVKPRLINNGKDGTRMVFAHTGVDPPQVRRACGCM